MLVRDVPLIRAIIDLVDNSLDGALRCAGNSPSLAPYGVRLTVSPDKLEVADNCGGIPIDVARNYAFRFGRSPDAPSTEHSIGQFGVGMKRTIFKVGMHFAVRSATMRSRF